MTREEIHKADQEDAKQTSERCQAWQKLSPEEQEAENRREIDDGVARAKAWLNSDERRKFDKQYAEKHEAARSEDEANRLEN